MKRYYIGLSNNAKKMLFKAFQTAKANNHKLIAKVYEVWDRDDGTPSHQDFDTSDVECPDDIATYILPEFYSKGGCVDIAIQFPDNSETYIWYHDNDEDRIYQLDIADYLATYLQ